MPGTYTRSDLYSLSALLQAGASDYGLPEAGRLADELAAAAEDMTDADTAMFLTVHGSKTPFWTVTSSETGRPPKPIRLTDHPFGTLMRIIAEGM